MSDFKWYYGQDEDCESYSGPCDTREEAVDEAISNGDAGEVWSIIEAAPTKIKRMNAEPTDLDYIGRDGLRVATDPLTGCEYLIQMSHGSITPRLDKYGRPRCPGVGI